MPKKVMFDSFLSFLYYPFPSAAAHLATGLLLLMVNSVVLMNNRYFINLSVSCMHFIFYQDFFFLFFLPSFFASLASQK